MGEIIERLEKIGAGLKKIGTCPENIDVIIAIGRGGIIPAAIIAKKLEKEMAIMWVRMYGDDMPPKKIYPAPVLAKPFDIDVSGRRALIVDDISRSASTLNFAKKILLEKGAADAITLAFAGRGADFCLFETDACAEFPWSKI